jgi:methylenetetrahydrofolate reductase (NADPH)
MDTAIKSDAAVRALLQSYSVELTTRDQKGIAAAGELLAPGSEVFVANLPGETADRLVAACAELAKSGVSPVPHMVARNTHSPAELDDTMARLAGEAGVHTCLVLGGDRDAPVGPYDASIQLIETGVFEKYGVKRLFIGCHPEGHPRVPDEVIWPALGVKVEAAKARGLETILVSQFAFDSGPMVAFAKRLRAAGIDRPFRVGVAGPAKQTTLIKYAIMCGVGASLRALRERHEAMKDLLAGETPERLLGEVADAQAADPSLGIEGVHFFTFGSVAKSVQLAEQLRKS